MLIVPDYIDLLEFFGDSPYEENKSDGYWMYEFIDREGVKLIFSCNEIEESIQAILNIGNYNLAIISGELASRISILHDKNGKYLTCDFSNAEVVTKVEIRVEPRISLRWFTLKV